MSPRRDRDAKGPGVPPTRGRARGPVLRRELPLGRVYGVVRQTWRLADDPRRTRAQEHWLMTECTAAEAADIARGAAGRLPRHGFHKRSGAWWGADDSQFHRFRVTRRRPRGLGGGLALAAVAASALLAWGLARPRPRPRAEPDRGSPA